MFYRQGILKKISKGIYYKPDRTEFGDLLPSTTDLLQLLLEQQKEQVAYLTGINTYNALWLTSQLSTEYIIATDRPRTPIAIGKTIIRFVPARLRQAPSSRRLPQLLAEQGLKDIHEAWRQFQILHKCFIKGVLGMKLLTYLVTKGPKELCGRWGFRILFCLVLCFLLSAPSFARDRNIPVAHTGIIVDSSTANRVNFNLSFKSIYENKTIPGWYASWGMIGAIPDANSFVQAGLIMDPTRKDHPGLQFFLALSEGSQRYEFYYLPLLKVFNLTDNLNVDLSLTPEGFVLVTVNGQAVIDQSNHIKVSFNKGRPLFMTEYSHKSIYENTDFRDCKYKDFESGTWTQLDKANVLTYMFVPDLKISYLNKNSFNISGRVSAENQDETYSGGTFYFFLKELEEKGKPLVLTIDDGNRLASGLVPTPSPTSAPTATPRPTASPSEIPKPSPSPRPTEKPLQPPGQKQAIRMDIALVGFLRAPNDGFSLLPGLAVGVSLPLYEDIELHGFGEWGILSFGRDSSIFSFPLTLRMKKRILGNTSVFAGIGGSFMLGSALPSPQFFLVGEVGVIQDLGEFGDLVFSVDYQSLIRGSSLSPIQLLPSIKVGHMF